MTKAGTEETVIRIPTNGISIEGNLTILHKAKAIVIFAHGSGSSRFSPETPMLPKKSMKQASPHCLLTC